MKVTVIRKPLRYHGMQPVGATVDMPRRVAEVFEALKRVTRAPIVDADMSYPAAPAAPITVVTTGEFDHPGLDAAEDASDLLGEPEAERKPAKQTRTYKRRDLKAQ